VDHLGRDQDPDRKHPTTAGVGPADQPDEAVPEHVEDAGLLAGDVRLDGLDEAGRVEGGDDGGADTLEHQVLAQQLEARVLVHLLGPGGHFAQAVFHTQRHSLDCQRTTNTFPQDRSTLPSVEVNHHWQQSHWSCVISSGIYIDLTLSPEDDERMTEEVLRQETRDTNTKPGILVCLLVSKIISNVVTQLLLAKILIFVQIDVHWTSWISLSKVLITPVLTS